MNENTNRLITIIIAVLTLIGTMSYYFLRVKDNNKPPKLDLTNDLEQKLLEIETTGISSPSTINWVQKLAEFQCEDFKDANAITRIQKVVLGSFDTLKFNEQEKLNVIRSLFELTNYVENYDCYDDRTERHKEVVNGRNFYLVPRNFDYSLIFLDGTFSAKLRYVSNEDYKFSIIKRKNLPSKHINSDTKKFSKDHEIIHFQRVNENSFRTMEVGNYLSLLVNMFSDNEYCFIADCHASNDSCHNCF